MTNKFKAGDKVRVLVANANGANVRKGEIGIHAGEGDRVNFPEQGDYWYLDEEYLELLEEKEVKEEEENPWRVNTGEMPVPKGTRVQVEHKDGQIHEDLAGVPGSYACSWQLCGSAGTIVKWRFPDQENPSSESEEEVESEEETPCTVKGYKVGDKFRVTGGLEYKEGSIVTLYRDDGSTAPLFAGEGTKILNADGQPGAFVGLRNVVKIEETPEPEWKENTGSMPVDFGTRVDVEHRNGQCFCFEEAGVYGHAEDWTLENSPFDIVKWRLSKIEKISEKSVDEGSQMPVLLPQQDETTTQEKEMSQFKVGDKVRVKDSVVSPKHSWGQVKKGDVGIVTSVGYDDIMEVNFPNHRGWNAHIPEMELVSRAENTEGQGKLVPFCLDMQNTTASQANEILVLALKLGAHLREAVYDDELDSDDVEAQFPDLAGASMFHINNYSYVGVDTDFDTYTYGTTDNYNDNVLTYEEAKEMLQGKKIQEDKKETVKVVQKAGLKSVCVKTEGYTAEKINSIFDRFAKLGVEIYDLAHDSSTNYEEVREKYKGRYEGSVCKISAFARFGIRKTSEGIITYISDPVVAFGEDVVELTPEELNAYLAALEGKTSKRKAPKLRQRKLQIVYTNDKPYLLKNVIGVEIKSETATVTVTYKQRKGKVIHNNNVVIPFSELKSVKFVGPDTIGAEYIFRAGKVVQVIQDFTQESFTHKSH